MSTAAAAGLLSEAFLPPRRRTGRKQLCSAVAGSGEALQVADYVQREQCSLLFISREPIAAYHLLEELAFFAPALPLRHLPDWETLPYDAFSPSAEIIGKRIAALTALLDNRPGITVTTAATMLLPCPPPAFLAARAFSLHTGEALSLATFTARLASGGYVRVPRVLAPGEYALYGGQIDIYPPETELPLRLVLAEDTIEQIRLFDPKTQRSVERVERFIALPMSECDLSPEGRRRFAANYETEFTDDRAAVRRRIKNSEGVAGIEYYLPLFYDTEATAFDYLSPESIIFIRAGLEESLAAFMHQARLRQKIISNYDNRPVLPAAKLFLTEERFFKALKNHSLTELKDTAAPTQPPPVPANARAARPQEKLIEFIRTFAGRVIIAVDGAGRAEALSEVLAAEGLTAVRCGQFADCLSQPLALIVAPLRGGFILPAANIAVITETEIFQTTLPPRARRAYTDTAAAAGGLYADEIRAGDYIVHREYGVGRAHGLKNMTVGGVTGEYLEIEYADTQRLFLPIAELHLLERHHGAEVLSKMGSRGWKRAVARAARRAHDAAARLLEINARRAAAATSGHTPDETLLAKFIDGFRHAETPDQTGAADAVLADLRQAKPMDRLVAADVGFGKTEIAMRAVAAVAFSGSQSALLAPTTLLAQQHYHTFCERFAGFPVKIACLTRLTSAPERRRLLADLQAGKINVVIGTHALLSAAVKYQQLGLLVIDEEHRFGVAHKEKFKALRAGVDMLALSATPIPRTLSMALGGIRDLSVMSTPPAARLPIQTIEAPFSHSVVAEACERELLRGGQIFFIHNEIASIGDIAEQLAKWLPQARIITAHGSMSGGELEDAMRRFLRRQGEILLCTTIVESGLDITNANTIIINRADKMGLSRLHQLRGRVGRGGVQAYAYLLRPEQGDISRVAEARLAAARDYGALGGGFFLAMRDLEIRGAGEILGERQSGDIETVGCAMYQRMVNNAARRLRGEPEQDSDISAAIYFTEPVLLPDTYIPSPVERMHYYRQLMNCTDDEALDAVFLEWEDRFGKPPPAAQLLKESHRLRLLLRACRAESLRVNQTGEMLLTFADEPPCRDQLLHLIEAGACVPAAENSVRRQLKSRGSLQQAQEAAMFMRQLAA